MPSTYSPNLRLELIGTGEQQGTWGSTTNTNLGTLLEEAIGGYTSVTVSNIADTTLTTNNGSADQSRNMVINLTGTISANRNVICPAIEKLYVVRNATTGGFSVTFKVAGQTGVTIPNGEIYFLYVNGVDAVKIVGNVASTNATNTFTENQIISVSDNTNAALRITQTGTGNALLVEDSTNPDSTPFVINAIGQMLRGSSNSYDAPNYAGSQLTPYTQNSGTASSTSGIALFNWSTSSTSGAPVLIAKSKSGTMGTPGIVAADDDIGEVTFSGDDSSKFVPAATIRAEVDGTPGVNDMPGRLIFATTSDGASSPTERMRINSFGNVNIGSVDDPETVLQITGSTNPTGTMIGSISGTTLTVSGVTSGSVSIGDRVFVDGTNPDYNTYVIALGTGTGGVGTYTINNSATVAGGTTIYFFPSRFNAITFVDTDTSVIAGQALGGVEWYGSDGSTPGAGVKAYVAAVSEGINGQSSLRFGTATTTAGTQAVERLRITSTGNVGIGNNSPAARLEVTANTSSDAVRITQTGAGNALVVEDSTNPDNTPFVIDANGRVTVGSTEPPAGFAAAGFNIVGRDTFFNASLARVTDNSTAPSLNFQKARGTFASPSSVVSGDSTGAIFFYGFDGTNSVISAAIFAQVDGTPGANDMPGRLLFSTTADGASSTTERMCITNAGLVGIGTTTPTATLDVVGSIKASLQIDTNLGFYGLATDTATAPSFTWTSDTNTGMFRPTTDTVAFTTGGAERMRVTSGGNVGIGTTSPSAELHVKGPSTSAADTIIRVENGNNNGFGYLAFGDSDDLFIGGIRYNHVNEDMAFYVNNDYQMYIKSDGKVGIGTSAPACLLDVRGGISTTRTTVTAPATTDGNIYSGSYTPTLTSVANVAASTPYLCQYMRVGNVITVSGRVGIDPTSANIATQLRMSLPVAATFSATHRCGGVFARGNAVSGNSGSISANPANNEALFEIVPSVNTDQDYLFSFTYTLGV